MSKREYIFEHGDVIDKNMFVNDADLKLIIPTNVEIKNNGENFKVGGLQIYGYEFDLRYTKYGLITFPKGNLTKYYLEELIKEFEGLILLLAENTIGVDNWC